MVGLAATVQVLSIRHETQTWDEAFELVGGYSYLTTGDYRVTTQHPPLARLLAALPLLYFRPRLPSKEVVGDAEAGRAFLYGNTTSAGTLLFAARLPMIAVTAAAILALAAWTRKRFGTKAALVAACLLGLDPNFLAHGRYVKHDVPVTLFAFLAVIAWEWFLDSHGKLALLAAGAALGLALGTKFNAVFLVPVFVILYVVHERRRLRFFAAARVFAITALTAFLVVAALYAPDAAALIPRTAANKGTRPPLHHVVDRGTAVGRTLAWTGARLGLRSHPLLTGLAVFAAHENSGHEAYLMGMYSRDGWWYYYPVAFLVKEPATTLLALALALAAAAGRLRVARLRRARFSWAVLIVPIAVYGAICCAGSVDIGIRLLLPIYPYLCAAVGAALASVRFRYRDAILAALIACLAAESLGAYPHFTSFFNRLAGGTARGPRYLLDSNIDWGQDLERLKDYTDAHGIRRICALYFGTAPMEYFGLNEGTLPGAGDLRKGAQLECQAIAASVTPLYGLYAPHDYAAWLRDIPPAARIGGSIYVWYVKDPMLRSALRKLRSSGP